MNDVNQGVDFVFGKSFNYDQIGDGYLEFDTTLRKNNGSSNNITDDSVDEPIKLVFFIFAIAFSTAILSKTVGVEIEENKHVRQLTTMMILVTSEEGDLLPYFDKIDESQSGVKRSSLNISLNNNQEEVANRRIV